MMNTSGSIVHYKKSKRHRNVVSLDGDISKEELEKKLVRIFSPYYKAGTLSREVIEDILVIRDLRMIVQTLKLCSGSDRTVNKYTFAVLLLRYLYSDSVTDSFINYTSDYEYYGDLEIIHCSKQYPRIDRTLQPPENIIYESYSNSSTELQPKKEEIKEEKKENFEKKTMTEKTDYCNDIASMLNRPVILPKEKQEPKNMINSKYLKTLKNLEDIINTMNIKVTELEKSVSILVDRLDKIEKNFMERNKEEKE